MSKEIPTSTLAGFPEFLPAEQIAFDRMKETIRATYERFGFAPLETPLVERPEVLFAKEGGETSKQVYRLAHGEGDGDMALRFDHTVPLARYVAEHQRDLAFPFRRYAIGRVYRGERAQKGRFREFYQCDIDVVGDGSLDLAHDADVVAVVSATFDALAVGEIELRVSNRKILQGLAASIGLAEKGAEIFRAVDRLAKIGEEKVRAMLADVGVSGDAADAVMRAVSVKGKPADVAASLRALGISDATFAAGVDELERVCSLAESFGVPAGRLVADVSIARGLDYYTGTVLETVLAAHPGLGSVCSGGRYDDLASAYTTRALPGVGVSIGLSRLFAQLAEIGAVSAGASSTAKVLVVPLTEDRSAPLALATALRAAGIPTEVYLDDKKASHKLAYADRKGIPLAVIIGEEELAAQQATLKVLATGEQRRVPEGEIVAAVMAALA
jgi:histidyl-tRNA synthetase